MNIVKKKFNFLNIDIEGLDYQVLKSINLNKYRPNLICIEILDKKILKDRKGRRSFFLLLRVLSGAL